MDSFVSDNLVCCTRNTFLPIAVSSSHLNLPAPRFGQHPLPWHPVPCPVSGRAFLCANVLVCPFSDHTFHSTAPEIPLDLHSQLDMLVILLLPLMPPPKHPR